MAVRGIGKLPNVSCIGGFKKSMANSSLEQLIRAASLLRPMLDELVFVGGSVTGLLITDEAAGDPRATLDVDTIAEITSYAQYTAFGRRLRALGLLKIRVMARRSADGFSRLQFLT